MDFKALLKKLPEQPGIYLMKNTLGAIIYVGKAKDLKKRVTQYFHHHRGHSPKVIEMIGEIRAFNTITTDTELEAFLLENKTIKEVKPKYNRQLMNPRGYKYIKLSLNEPYPKISMVVQKKQDGLPYFGPFTSEGSVERTIAFIRDYYGIRKCSSRRTSSGCLNFHLGSCMGPCLGHTSQEDYRKRVDKVIKFLEGNDGVPLKDLHVKMKASAEKLDFETAARLRDQIRGIRHVLNKQKVIKISERGRCILAAEKYGNAEYKLFFIKGNKLLHTEWLSLSARDEPDFEDKLKTLTKDHFKPRGKEKEDCLCQEEIDEAQIIYSYLKKKNNGIKSIKIPFSRIDRLDYNRIKGILFE